MAKLLFKTKRDQRGQSTIELALTAPLLVALLLGLIEFGNGMNAYLTVLASSRDAARLGSQVGASDESRLRNLVATETSRLSPAIPTASEVCTTGQAGVCVTTGSNSGTDNWVNVKVCHDHHLIVGVPWASFDSFLMCSFTKIRIIP
jgi:Flp pilus assembly protein TadG